MPYFTVIARHGGNVELLSADAAEDVELGEGDKNIGEFHAETEPEAWRQLVTANPSINMETKRLVIDADGDAAVAQQKADFLAKVRKDAINNIELPDDTGAPEEMEEVEEEDADTGEKRTVKKPKKAKKAAKKAHK